MASGTQSPPLESTGEHQPIGAASKDGKPLPEGVKDSEQRAAYFGGEPSGPKAESGSTGVSAEAIAGAEKAAKDVESKDLRS
ncbi:hypothetical protein FS749_003587 [Ceratobasidium sp. UAMH 11750]|nr:hypothetical protein FS749_003587 [Ceratobasidium sp. UAMH 11750]